MNKEEKENKLNELMETFEKGLIGADEKKGDLTITDLYEFFYETENLGVKPDFVAGFIPDIIKAWVKAGKEPTPLMEFYMSVLSSINKKEVKENASI